ncbi:hypothetical protein Avbf_04531 [Armadillidium vulgare]|nr:hypothetical protein Avbf_04531 [Armadillidium vulgare]
MNHEIMEGLEAPQKHGPPPGELKAPYLVLKVIKSQNSFEDGTKGPSFWDLCAPYITIETDSPPLMRSHDVGFDISWTELYERTLIESLIAVNDLEETYDENFDTQNLIPIEAYSPPPPYSRTSTPIKNTPNVKSGEDVPSSYPQDFTPLASLKTLKSAYESNAKKSSSPTTNDSLSAKKEVQVSFSQLN